MPNNFVPFTSRYNTAALASLSSQGYLYYSLNIGPVRRSLITLTMQAHIIFLSSYTDFLPLSFQYDWLLNDLQSVNREITPWVIATFHGECCIRSTSCSLKRSSILQLEQSASA
jgi:hypothetical protein